MRIFSLPLATICALKLFQSAETREKCLGRNVFYYHISIDRNNERETTEHVYNAEVHVVPCGGA